MSTQYRAKWGCNGRSHKTRFYDSPIVAQRHLQSYIGHFHLLGEVAGDAFEFGRCTAAPRNGGLVTIETREKL